MQGETRWRRPPGSALQPGQQALKVAPPLCAKPTEPAPELRAGLAPAGHDSSEPEIRRLPGHLATQPAAESKGAWLASQFSAPRSPGGLQDPFSIWSPST